MGNLNRHIREEHKHQVVKGLGQLGGAESAITEAIKEERIENIISWVQSLNVSFLRLCKLLYEYGINPEYADALFFGDTKKLPDGVSNTKEMIEMGKLLKECTGADIVQIGLSSPLLVIGVHDEVLKESNIKLPFDADNLSEVNKVIKKRLLVLHKVLFREEGI